MYIATLCQKSLLQTGVALLITFQLFSATPVAANQTQAPEENEIQPDQEESLAETYRQLEIFSNVLSMLRENYVEEVDTPKVIKGAIKGLLQSLDPHSTYLSPEAFRDLREETSGQFSGIGIEVTIQDDELTIVSPIARTPAARTGLKAGDIIVAIDGEKTKEIGSYQAIEKLRGPIGSTVSITIQRKGWTEPKEFSIIRAHIPLVSVEGEMLASGLAYVRITNFQQNTSTELRKTLNSFTEKHLHGLILDLRNNPGGLLEQAVEVVDIFLNQGVIVSTRGRRDDQNMIFMAHNNSSNTEYPLVILINEGSASASEIVAGAVQAHQRGILVGTRSFGKGSVQTIIPLPDGAGVRMTTAKYYTPNDQSIQAVGITPDVIVSLQDQRQDQARHTTPAVVEAALPNHLPEEMELDGERPQAQADSTSELQTKLAQDNQLKAAYNILVSLVLYTEQMQKQKSR